MNIISLNPAARAPCARKPRILVAGEFSAGKTRLINGLLGRNVLPSNVVSTSLPPVWLIGEGDAAFRVALDGTRHDLASMDDARLDGTHYLVLSLDAPFLAKFDIIDTPGNSDPNIPSEYWERMIDHADAVIWCTNATQAWRQSEKSAWREMPERLRDNAVLLVTHSDRMPDEDAAAKVMRRVRRDVKEDFASIMMASLIDPDHIAAIGEQLEALLAGIVPASADHPAMTEILREIRATSVGRIAPRRIRNPLLPPEPEAASADVLLLDQPLPAGACLAADPEPDAPVADAPDVALETADETDEAAAAEAEGRNAPDEVEPAAEAPEDAAPAEVAADTRAAEDLEDAAPEDEAPDAAAVPVLEDEDATVEDETAVAPEAEPEARDAATDTEPAPEDRQPEHRRKDDAFGLAGPHPVRSPYPGFARDTWNLICYGHDLSDTDTLFACIEATLSEIDRSLAAHAPAEPELRVQDGEATDSILRNVASAITASRGEA